MREDARPPNLGQASQPEQTECVVSGPTFSLPLVVQEIMDQRTATGRPVSCDPASAGVPIHVEVESW
jgi:hypothetical protein